MESEHSQGKRQPRRRRDERLFVTLTEREKNAIVEAANIDGIGPTEWARARLLEQAGKRLKVAKRAERLVTILGARDAKPALDFAEALP